MSLIALKALKPLVGSYECTAAEADTIEDVLVDGENGEIIKRRRARKRYRGFVDVERRATVAEIQAAIEGRLPPNIEVLGAIPKVAVSVDGSVAPMMVREYAAPFSVPQELADDLVKRGMAERVRA